MICSKRMSIEDHKTWRLKLLNLWEESLEVRLAAIKAAKSKLEEQMKIDATERLHNNIREENNS